MVLYGHIHEFHTVCLVVPWGGKRKNKGKKIEMVSKDKTNWFSIGDFKFREGKKEYIFPVFDLQRGGEGNIYEWRIETAAKKLLEQSYVKYYFSFGCQKDMQIDNVNYKKNHSVMRWNSPCNRGY